MNTRPIARLGMTARRRLARTVRVVTISVVSVLVAVASMGAAAQTLADDNSPATGAPTLSGTPEVGQTLTVDVSGISDDDGMENTEFSYQWYGDYDYSLGGGWVLPIADATSNEYQVDSWAAGKRITVEVSFTDDAGNAERLVSVPTEVVPGPITGIMLVDTSGQSDVEILTDEGVIALSDLGGRYVFRAELADGAQVGSVLVEVTDPERRWRDRIDDRAPFTSEGEDVDGLIGGRLSYGTYVLSWTAFSGAGAQGDRLQGIDIVFTVSPDDWDEPPTSNSRSAGAPTVSGTAAVSQTLTAATSGIFDADGLDDAVFSYQWLADGEEISGATGSSYELQSGDEGKAIKVRVSFTDDAGFEESLTSAATASVQVGGL